MEKSSFLYLAVLVLALLAQSATAQENDGADKVSDPGEVDDYGDADEKNGEEGEISFSLNKTATELEVESEIEPDFELEAKLKPEPDFELEEELEPELEEELEEELEPELEEELEEELEPELEEELEPEPDSKVDVESEPDPKQEPPCMVKLTLEEKRQLCPSGDWQNRVNLLKPKLEQLKQKNEDLKQNVEKIRQRIEKFENYAEKVEIDSQNWQSLLYFPSVVTVSGPTGDRLQMSEPTDSDFLDCQDALDKGSQKPGVYLLQPEGSPYKVMALCIEGWTIIQRRYDGSEDFYRLFEDYLKGFGNFSGEFWLGLENIYQITKQRSYTLRVDVSGATGKWYYGVYPMFSLGAETTAYELHVNNMSSGNYFDGMADGNGQGFSSRDVDSDKWRSGNCARYYRGGWWTGTCDTDLNRMWCGRPGCLQWAGRKMMTSMIRIKPTESVVKEDTEENPNPGGLLP